MIFRKSTVIFWELKKIKLKQAVSAADYEFTGAEHTALSDAVNTAEILRLSKRPEEFEKVMKPVLDLFRPEGNNTLLEMCPEFLLLFLAYQKGIRRIIKFS